VPEICVDEKIFRVVLRLLREYESAWFSLHKYEQIVDNRECPLARGEDPMMILKAQE